MTKKSQKLETLRASKTTGFFAFFSKTKSTIFKALSLLGEVFLGIVTPFS
jgi:hypothetical protein